MPVGNAGNITAYWKGYSEAQRDGTTSERPVMFGFQAEGAAPIVRGAVVEEPDTIATAIRIGNPASWQGALQAAEESNGRILSVHDDDIVLAYRSLAEEGIFVELASAAAVAGLRRLKETGAVPPGAVIVCVLTGNGLKDPDRAIGVGPGPQTVDAEAGAILVKLGLA